MRDKHCTKLGLCILESLSHCWISVEVKVTVVDLISPHPETFPQNLRY
jgi:hypothetical protein